MKKITFLLIGSFLLMNVAYAGGILTNTNQSAQFVRMLSRNASTDLDAVYFNPAGLTQLKNGFHFGIHNQTILQTKTITSEFPVLNYDEYIGDVKAPVFPTAFAVYKKDSWAFSFGFGPNGGGGSASYDKGLPSFEKRIASIPTSLRASGIPTTSYSTNINFDGSSVFWGTQLNGSYAINDIISVSAGVRIILAGNTYKGYLKDIMINPNYPAFNPSYTGGMVSAPKFFADGNTFLKGMAANSTTAANGLSGAISAGTPASTPLSAMPSATVTAVTQLLGAAGISASGMSIGTAATTLNTVAVGFSGKAAAMDANAVATADKEVDAKQTGTGFTPLIGVNIHLEKLNIGLKYEMLTILKLTNSTSVDGTGLFPDGEESRSDIPAILAAGADYMVTDKLKASGSFNLYFDKNVNWGRNVYGQERTIDKNYVELIFGLEYNLTKKFAVSAGYMNSNTGVSDNYQSDFSYSNDSYTIGLGFQWKLNKRLVLDAGAMMTTYKDAPKSFVETGKFDQTNTDLIKQFGPYNENYKKETLTFGIGLGYSIF